ncbi:retrovirus-related pol polyprotein from transposon TNT 1-94 [Tanacetum coccineum]
MSTQQDIYAADSENCPPILNKDNYVPWSSRLLCYAKSKPNGELLVKSILGGPYQYRMIKEPGNPNHTPLVLPSSHLQTDDELTATKAKQVKADDQAIQTILIGLPEDIYATEKEAKFLNELERFTSTEGESVESYYHLQNVRNQVGQNAVQNSGIQNVGNQNGLTVVSGIANQNRNGNVVAARAEGNGNGNNANQIRCYNYRGVGIQLQVEEFDLKADAAECEEIEEVNANCILMANLQQVSTSGTHADKAPIYNSDGSVEVIKICLWCINLGCSKHMTGNLKLFINFDWKFMGTVHFRNDQVATILVYGVLQWGNMLITWVYFVEGLGHNLFSVGQFCDSDFEVAFRRNSCFVNLDGVDLLKGNRSTNLYTINLHEITSESPICLMARATSTKSWLWHQRLSHLNFDIINTLAKYNLITGLPKFKYTKDHLCPSCEQGKSKKLPHKPKPVLDSKNRTANGTEFTNQVLKAYFEYVGIFHQTSVVKTPQQNREVERRNRTLVEAARTMLVFSSAPLFLWADAVATACYTQNRSLIHKRFNKTTYELINERKPDISYLHVFRALCYPKNDREDIGKLGAKAMYDDYMGGQLSDATRTSPTAPSTLNL